MVGDRDSGTKPSPASLQGVRQLQAGLEAEPGLKPRDFHVGCELPKQ